MSSEVVMRAFLTILATLTSLAQVAQSPPAKLQATMVATMQLEHC
jgi:hypothetical protein